MDSRLFEAIQLLRAVVGGNPDVGAIREFLADRKAAIGSHVRNKLDPWVCTDCGSEEVEQDGWIDCNTDEPVGGDGPSYEVHCRRCHGSPVRGVVRRSEFEKERLNPSR